MKIRTELFIHSGSLVYEELCKLKSGCFNTRTAALDIFADHDQKTPSIMISADIANDGNRVIHTDFKTKEAGGILTATVTSTSPALKAFIFSLDLASNTGDVRLNGDKVCDVTVAPQKSLQNRDGWESNNAKVTFKGAVTDIEAQVDWDGLGGMEVDASGVSTFLGQFTFHRVLDIKETATGSTLKVTGNTETEKGYIKELGLNNVPYDIDLEFNTDKGVANGRIGSVVVIEDSNIVFI